MENEVYFFYNQEQYPLATKRFRKLPEDLPESLKYAHLNPKVAAFLANKEKQKQEEDLFGDGLGKKSLMPEINEAFQHIKNQFDSSLMNDEDSQRYLFEEAKTSASNILNQLSRIIYYYEDICSVIPKSLEYQLMTGYRELTADVILVPREWQTLASKEAYLRSLAEQLSDEDRNYAEDEGRGSRTNLTEPQTAKIKKKVSKSGLPEIVEDEETGRMTGLLRRSDSKNSPVSRGGRSQTGKARNMLGVDSRLSDESDSNETQQRFQIEETQMTSIEEIEETSSVDDSDKEINRKPFPVDGSDKGINHKPSLVDGSGKGITHRASLVDGSGKGINRRASPVDGSGKGINRLASPVDGLGKGINRKASLVDGPGKGINCKASPVDGSGKGINRKASPVDGSGKGINRKASPVDGPGKGINCKASPVDGSGKGINRKASPVDGSGKGINRWASLVDGLGKEKHRKASPVDGSGKGKHRKASPVDGSGKGINRWASLVDGLGKGKHRKASPVDGSGKGINRWASLVDGLGKGINRNASPVDGLDKKKNIADLVKNTQSRPSVHFPFPEIVRKSVANARMMKLQNNNVIKSQSNYNFPVGTLKQNAYKQRSKSAKVGKNSKTPCQSCKNLGKQKNQRSHSLKFCGSIRSPGMRRGHDDFMSVVTETMSDSRSIVGTQSYLMSFIQFQLSSKLCEEKGWIIQNRDENKIERDTLLELCVTRLQQCMKITKEQQLRDKQAEMDKPVHVRYYGDTRKETLLKYRKSPVKQTSNPALKGQKPLIPLMYDDKDEGKTLCLTSHLDGSSVVYYPSGRVAIMFSAAGFGCPGNYLLAFDDDPEMKMLGCFTPAGKGCIYHRNGNIRFLATHKGGHVADKDGTVLQKWKWPQGNVKITSPISFQINQSLAFRCVTQSQMVVCFTCNKEACRFVVAPVVGAVEPKYGDENEQLLTSFTFSSLAAKDLLNLFGPKTKSKFKPKKKMDRYKGQLAELQKMYETQDKDLYDTEAEKELARLQRKTRILVDDWMEHYRITVGLGSSSLNKMLDTPKKRHQYSHSAKLSEDKVVRQPSLGLNVSEQAKSRAMRAPSAPADPGKRRRPRSAVESSSPSHLSTQASVKFSDSTDKLTPSSDDPHTSSPSASAIMNRLVEGSMRPYSADSQSKSLRQLTFLSLPEHVLTHYGACPTVVRQLILGQERPQCHCSRHTVTYITDVEFDEFMHKTSAEGQLQIVAVVSSIFHDANIAEEMLDNLYENMNRNRTRPCLQCRTDMYRIFKYDINTAAENTNHTQPLLLTRHNVVPGMFLIYCDGRLLFCDHIFNGYGISRKDLKKQIMNSRKDFASGFCLPKDFKFSPSHGALNSRSPWGDETGDSLKRRRGPNDYSLTLKTEPAIAHVNTPQASSNMQGIRQRQASYHHESHTHHLPPAHRSNKTLIQPQETQ